MRKEALALLFMAGLVGACAGDETARGGAEVVQGGRPGIDTGAARPGGRPDETALSAARAAWEREVIRAGNGVGDRVFFALDQSDLSPEAQQTLRRQAEWLRRYAAVTVTIEGHADERGTREYNLALGDRRAAAVKNFLVAAGIPARRLQTITYGKERPAVVGSNEAAYSKNRRAVTTID